MSGSIEFEAPEIPPTSRHERALPRPTTAKPALAPFDPAPASRPRTARAQSSPKGTHPAQSLFVERPTTKHGRHSSITSPASSVPSPRRAPRHRRSTSSPREPQQWPELGTHGPLSKAGSDMFIAPGNVRSPGSVGWQASSGALPPPGPGAIRSQRPSSSRGRTSAASHSKRASKRTSYDYTSESSINIVGTSASEYSEPEAPSAAARAAAPPPGVLRVGSLDGADVGKPAAEVGGVHGRGGVD